MLRVGIIADTHGLLRPRAVTALAGSDLLLHAGDVGSPEILARLQELAPVHVVRGNVDTGEWAQNLPFFRSLTLESVTVLLHHGHVTAPERELELATVVVQGHSHKPELRWHDGTLYLNPGSAGQRRFSLPVSVARLTIRGTTVDAELVDLTAEV